MRQCNMCFRNLTGSQQGESDAISQSQLEGSWLYQPSLLSLVTFLPAVK